MFTSFCKVFIETSFHLLFSGLVPLLPLEEMIESYNETSEKPYLLNILMRKAQTDVGKLLEKGPIETFKDFFPMFRDCILGVVYMHMNAIAHRDIKPGNIMKMRANTYVLGDYGEGENLSY